MVGKKNKKDRIQELIKMAEKEGGKYDIKKLGYKIEELSIDMSHKNRKERGKIIRKFLSKHPDMKELIIQAHLETYPYRPHDLEDILLIDTFIKYITSNEGFDHYEVTVRVKVRTEEKSSRATFYEMYGKSYYLRYGEVDKLIKFLEKNLES